MDNGMIILGSLIIVLIIILIVLIIIWAFSGDSRREEMDKVESDIRKIKHQIK